MYAVIESGGKQYRVQPGDVIQVEKLEGDLGSLLSFDKVLFINKGNEENPVLNFGKPFISGALVQGEVVGQGRGDKILIIKMKRRKQYRRTQGHRQEYTQILVTCLSEEGNNISQLDEATHKKALSQFHSQLKPKGPAFSNPYCSKKVAIKS